MTSSDLIDRLEADVRLLLVQVREQFADLPESRTRHRLEPGQWTITECYAHLNLIYDWYLPRAERAIHLAKARNWVSEQPVQYRGRGGRLIRRMHPERRKKIVSSKKFDPVRHEPGPAPIKSFLIHTERLLRILESARGIDLNRPRIRKAGAWFATYRLGNLLEWIVLYGQRHVAQAETRLKSAGG